ncbi:MAG: DUF512 domain-containing protein [Chitinispirillaceae bacterium]|nr:DUF512 domain-containing protein [Chitinispirillaceae bacterium]
MRPRDVLFSINNERIGDELDFRFRAATSPLHIDFYRKGRKRSVTIERKQGAFLDIKFYQKPIRRCANRCVFCFIDQMPPGLRKRLYIKDEDISHSFLNGNYVTLTNATTQEMQRIVTLGLSPLYVSVHASDPQVRARMLGVKRAPTIMDQLLFLKSHGIRFHTQIVVCPGYNDGDILTRTIHDLLSLGTSLLSVAVVPVGLTRFRPLPLRPVTAGDAVTICTTVLKLSDRDKARCGSRRVFCSDEFLLAAGEPIPPEYFYETFPQIENGVGLIRRFLADWRRAVRSYKKKRHAADRQKKKYLLLCSVSAYPFIAPMADETATLRALTVRVIPVVNLFFGETVTVAGLLTARDVMHAIDAAQKKERFSGVFVPAVMFNYAGYTLDGFSPERIARMTGTRLHVIQTPQQLLER